MDAVEVARNILWRGPLIAIGLTLLALRQAILRGRFGGVYGVPVTIPLVICAGGALGAAVVPTRYRLLGALVGAAVPTVVIILSQYFAALNQYIPW
jgi:hypothetical protein